MHSPGPALRPNMATGSPVTGITSYTCPSSAHQFVTLPRQGYARNAALPTSTNKHPGRPPLQQNPLPQVNAWTSGPTAVPSTYAQTAPPDRSENILPSPAVAPIKPLSVPPKHQQTALSSGMAEKASEDRRSGCSGLSRRSRITIATAILLAITRLIGNRTRRRPRHSQQTQAYTPSNGTRRGRRQWLAMPSGVSL
jgi:hypothetical protein